MQITMLHLVHRMKTHTWTGNSRGFDLAAVAGIASCVHVAKEATANFAPTGSSGLPRSGGGGTRPGLHQACPPLPLLPRQPLLPPPKHPQPQRPHQGPHAGPPPRPRRRAAGAGVTLYTRSEGCVAAAGSAAVASCCAAARVAASSSVTGLTPHAHRHSRNGRLTIQTTCSRASGISLPETPAAAPKLVLRSGAPGP